MSHPKTIGIAGAGPIGAGWAARLLFRGFDIIAYDPWPGAEDRLRAAVDLAWPAMTSLFPDQPRRGNLVFTNDVEAMASRVDFIHEAVSDRIETKRWLYQDLDEYSRRDVVIASSFSDHPVSVLQEECQHPERIVIAHPLSPVYLLPRVELGTGRRTSEAAFSLARKYLQSLDMTVLPLQQAGEVARSFTHETAGSAGGHWAYIADRLADDLEGVAAPERAARRDAVLVDLLKVFVKHGMDGSMVLPASPA